MPASTTPFDHRRIMKGLMAQDTPEAKYRLSRAYARVSRLLTLSRALRAEDPQIDGGLEEANLEQALLKYTNIEQVSAKICNMSDALSQADELFKKIEDHFELNSAPRLAFASHFANFGYRPWLAPFETILNRLARQHAGDDITYRSFGQEKHSNYFASAGASMKHIGKRLANLWRAYSTAHEGEPAPKRGVGFVIDAFSFALEAVKLFSNWLIDDVLLPFGAEGGKDGKEMTFMLNRIFKATINIPIVVTQWALMAAESLVNLVLFIPNQILKRLGSSDTKPISVEPSQASAGHNSSESAAAAPASASKGPAPVTAARRVTDTSDTSNTNSSDGTNSTPNASAAKEKSKASARQTAVQ